MEVSSVNSRFIDYHSHFYDRAWFPSPSTTGQGILAHAWPLLTDFDPATIRFAIDLLGAEHVLAGSDWPIMPIASRHYVDELLAKLDLTEQQKAVILGGNTTRLLAKHFTSP